MFSTDYHFYPQHDPDQDKLVLKMNKENTVGQLIGCSAHRNTDPADQRSMLSSGYCCLI